MSINPINMRLYRRFDADLIALHESGIPVNVLAEILLEIYAKGKHVTLIPDGCEQFDVGKRKCMHLSVNVRSKEAEMLVRQIKRGYRNQFCKSLVRDALRTIPLWVYFSKDEYVSDEDRRLREFGNENSVVILPHGLRRKAYRTLILNAATDIGTEEAFSDENIQTQKSEKVRKKKNKNKQKPKEEKTINREENTRIQNQFSDDIEGWDKEYKGTPQNRKNETQSKVEEPQEPQEQKNDEDAMSELMKSFNSLF